MILVSSCFKMVSFTSLRNDALYVNCNIRLSGSSLAMDKMRVVLPVPATASTITLSPLRTSSNICCCSSLKIMFCLLIFENLRYYSIQGSRLICFTNITRQGSHLSAFGNSSLSTVVRTQNKRCNITPSANKNTDV